MMIDEAFQRIDSAGRAAVLTGAHHIEVPPDEGGRWGTSVVMWPTDGLAQALDRLTLEAIALAGESHWRSASLGRAHVTIRALDPYTEQLPKPDEVDRYHAALDRALVGCDSLRLHFAGLVLSPAGIMARAYTPDGKADELRRRFGQELGPDGWLEDAVFANGRDPIWYCTLVHFTGPIAQPQALVDWVEARNDLLIGKQSFRHISLCRWRADSAGMGPQVVRSIHFKAPHWDVVPCPGLEPDPSIGHRR